MTHIHSPDRLKVELQIKKRVATGQTSEVTFSTVDVLSLRHLIDMLQRGKKPISSQLILFSVSVFFRLSKGFKNTVATGQR